jgi:hypothetical protein
MIAQFVFHFFPAIVANLYFKLTLGVVRRFILAIRRCGFLTFSPDRDVLASVAYHSIDGPARPLASKAARALRALHRRPAARGRAAQGAAVHLEPLHILRLHRRQHDGRDTIQPSPTRSWRRTGEFGRLQVINSGSIQELPLTIRKQVRDLLAAKDIREFWTESYWAYRKDYDETRRFFGVPTYLFLGVETFDDDLRNRVLNKSMHWNNPDEVAAATDSICLMIGFRGQTQDIIRRDVDLLLTKFKYGFINMFSENRLSAGLMDEGIKDWFHTEYAWLEKEPNVTVLWKNTGLGVG